MGQGARELSQVMRGALHDFFVQAAEQNIAAASQTNLLLTDVLAALRSQPGMQVFQYFDQRQHHVLTQIQNIMTFAPRFQQQINFDQRMQIGRMMLQNVVNVLHNQQIQTTPQNVNGALLAITNGQLALQDVGGEVAIPLPEAVRTDMPVDPLSPTSLPNPSPTLTGVEADVPTETTVRDPAPRSPTLQEVPTEPEPPPSSPAETEMGDWQTDALLLAPPPKPGMLPPPPPPPKHPVRIPPRVVEEKSQSRRAQRATSWATRYEDAPKSRGSAPGCTRQGSSNCDSAPTSIARYSESLTCSPCRKSSIGCRNDSTRASIC